MKPSGYGTHQVSVSRILKDLSLEIVSRDNPVSSNSRPLRVFLDNLSFFWSLSFSLENLNTERLSRAIRSEAG